jgi:hypothetical protein
MRFKTLSLMLLCGTAAFAAVPGSYVYNYSITNNSGQTANNLEVALPTYVSGAGALISTSTTFSSDVFDTLTNTITLTGGSVAPGQSAELSISQNVLGESAGPFVESYYWTSGATQVGAAELPLGIAFEQIAPSDPSTYGALGTDDTANHDYAGLYVNQAGSSLLTVSSSGSIISEAVTNAFLPYPAVTFGYTDTISGITVNGTFTGGFAPEPATAGLCAFLLLAMGAAVWRKRAAAR